VVIIIRNSEKREVIISHERANNSILRVITDIETGEIIDQTWIHETKSKPGRKENVAHFIKLYKTNLMQLVTEKAKEKKLDLNEAGLFFMLLAISGWQTPYIVNPISKKNMSCSAIADYLGLDRKNVANLLERLIAKGMISKVVNGNGRANHYMINPNIAFWGKTIDDLNHLDVFKDCPFKPKVYIKYKKTPDKKK